jgi:hypothetical protein
MRRPYPTWISRAFVGVMTFMAVTGMFQLPLGKRYYVNEVPGLAWLADVYIVHKAHYVGAAVLLFLVGLVAAHWLLEWRDRLRLTPLGTVRVVVLGGIIASGGLRVIRNLPDVTLDPVFVLLFDWVHLVLTMLLGGVALAALLRGRSAYATLK